MTLSELLELYEKKQLRASSPNTLRLYRHTIRSFSKTIGKIPTVANLTDDEIERHLWRVVGDGNSPASANKDRAQLVALWNFAFDIGILKNRPRVKAMVEPERVPMGWLPAEVEALAAACRSETSSIGSVPGSLWFGTLVAILLDTGERVGAVRMLPKDSLQGDFLLVPAHLRKGRKRDRLYPLNADTIELIEKLQRAHDGKLLFEWPYGYTYLYHRFNRILERAGLPTDRRSKFHRIRRTVASAVARSGGDASAALDHASPKTTKKYLDPRIVGGVPVSEILAAYLSDPELRKQKRRKTG